MTDLEKDILRELMNIILAKAGDSFAKLSKEEVIINVPSLYAVDKETALKELFDDREVEIIIQSEIKGDIYAHSLIIFSKRQIQMFERACLNTENVTKSMRESLLLEISNIVTGTLVSYLADILNINIYGCVPSAPVYRDTIREEELLLDLDLTRPVLFTVNTVFKASRNHADIPMILIFDVPNLEKIVEMVRRINRHEFILLKK
ncbi:chemotaxis protein CheC [Fulvivirga ulvae]|uniref:chemotaxis protein CheC n=1 Tax=Fulvivirga ulvae TaxID=2904245 RepID=UPI001F20920E|nr:chemotaxis protein CheC [Fulvivirga ulvae]UII33334.1 chemotaxis protein CheC [Fulvivirga ulvae]